MRLQLADPTVLKDSISVISELVTEGRFKITSDGIELLAMDPANVAMVIYKLLSSAFTEFDVKEPMEIGVNLTNFKQILRRVKASDILTLEVTDDNKLQLELKSKTTRRFSLPIINLEEKEQRVPNLTFPVTIQMPSGALTDVIDDVGIIAESVSFAAEPNKFFVAAEGDLSKADIDIAATEDVIIKADTSAKVRSKYSIEYLKKIMQGAKIADNVSVQFSQDYPLKVEYKVVDTILLSFILAPRVEND